MKNTQKYIGVEYLEREGDKLTVYGFEPVYDYEANTEIEKYLIRYNDSKHQFADYVLTEKELESELKEQPFRVKYYAHRVYTILGA